MTIDVAIKRLAHGEGLALPSYQSDGAAGLDLCAAVPHEQPVTLDPGTRGLIPTGLAIALPISHEAQIRPRSGLALKHGISVLNAPGTIDSDYRGEIGIILINHGAEPFVISRGDRIAQMVIAPVTQAVFFESDDLSETERGTGGFGSSGTRSN